MPPLLFLLALGNLVIGSSAFLIGGIVGDIAQDLGVGAPAVGQAMTVYALSTALFAPLLVVATGRWPRKRALLLALLIFTFGNALCAMAHSLPLLLLGRAVMGAGSMFTPVAAAIALASVAPARRGTALSLVFLGMSLSYVIGLPLGAWVSLHYGWHVTLWAMTAASALMCVAAAYGVPAAVQAPGASFAGLAAVLRRPDVLAMLLTTMAYFCAIFTTVSYFTPVLQALVPMPGSTLSLTLMAFGLAGVAGTLIGGAAHDRFGALRTMGVQMPALATTMLLLPFTAGHYGAMVVVLLVWACAGFGLMTPQQNRLAELAPAQAPLLLSLNSSMLYIGTALGAAVGGAALGNLGFARLPWVGAPFALLGLALVLLPGRMVARRGALKVDNRSP